MSECLVVVGSKERGVPTLLARNADRPSAEVQVLERYPADRRAEPIRATHVEVEAHDAETIGFVGSRPWWGWGVEHGVNEAGVAVGHQPTASSPRNGSGRPGLTGMDLVRLGLERGASAVAAVEVVVDQFARYGQGGAHELGSERASSSSFLVADADEAFAVTTSGSTWKVARFGPGEAHRLTDGPQVALESVGAAVVHLRAHGTAAAPAVCRHGDDGADATTASMVAEVGGPIRFLLGTPCGSVYVPLYVHRPLGLPVRWERLAGPSASSRARLDELERSLEADVRDDEDWAFEAWRRVDRVLAEGSQV